MTEARPPLPDDIGCFIGSPREVFKRAEEKMIQRRSQLPDMHGAVTQALTAVLFGEVPPPNVTAAGQAIADAVTAYAASLAPAGEPPYHNQYHQAEATVAMGWLCAAARRFGLLDAKSAVAGVLAMAGHDLQHNGSVPPAGVLEARSAALTVALAARAGLDEAAQATIRRVILATNPDRAANERAGDDLLCRLAQEADLFGSLTPELGWQLTQALVREMRAAQSSPQPPIESFTGRLRLLSSQVPSSPPSRQLGLEYAIEDQIRALAAFGYGDAERGAARLDARPPAQARADYLTALAAVVRK